MQHAERAHMNEPTGIQTKNHAWLKCQAQCKAGSYFSTGT